MSGEPNSTEKAGYQPITVADGAFIKKGDQVDPMSDAGWAKKLQDEGQALGDKAHPDDDTGSEGSKRYREKADSKKAVSDFETSLSGLEKKLEEAVTANDFLALQRDISIAQQRYEDIKREKGASNAWLESTRTHIEGLLVEQSRINSSREALVKKMNDIRKYEALLQADRKIAESERLSVQQRLGLFNESVFDLFKKPNKRRAAEAKARAVDAAIEDYYVHEYMSEDEHLSRNEAKQKYQLDVNANQRRYGEGIKTRVEEDLHRLDERLSKIPVEIGEVQGALAAALIDVKQKETALALAERVNVANQEAIAPKVSAVEDLEKDVEVARTQLDAARTAMTEAAQSVQDHWANLRKEFLNASGDGINPDFRPFGVGETYAEFEARKSNEAVEKEQTEEQQKLVEAARDRVRGADLETTNIRELAFYVGRSVDGSRDLGLVFEDLDALVDAQIQKAERLSRISDAQAVSSIESFRAKVDAIRSTDAQVVEEKYTQIRRELLVLTPAEMSEQVQNILNKQALSNSDVLATSFDLAVTEEELYKYNQPGSPYLNPEVRKGIQGKIDALERKRDNARNNLLVLRSSLFGSAVSEQWDSPLKEGWHQEISLNKFFHGGNTEFSKVIAAAFESGDDAKVLELKGKFGELGDFMVQNYMDGIKVNAKFASWQEEVQVPKLKADIARAMAESEEQAIRFAGLSLAEIQLITSGEHAKSLEEALKVKKEIGKWMRVLSNKGRAEVVQELANARLAVEAEKAELEDEVKLAEGQFATAKALYEGKFSDPGAINKLRSEGQALWTELAVIREGVKNGSRTREEYVKVRDRLAIVKQELAVKGDYLKAERVLVSKRTNLLAFDAIAQSQLNKLREKLLPTELIATDPAQARFLAFGDNPTAIGRLYSDLIIGTEISHVDDNGTVQHEYQPGIFAEFVTEISVDNEVQRAYEETVANKESAERLRGLAELLGSGLEDDWNNRMEAVGKVDDAEIKALPADVKEGLRSRVEAIGRTLQAALAEAMFDAGKKPFARKIGLLFVTVAESIGLPEDNPDFKRARQALTLE